MEGSGWQISWQIVCNSFEYECDECEYMIDLSACVHGLTDSEVTHLFTHTDHIYVYTVQ